MKPNKVKLLVAVLITGLFLLTGCTATKTAKVEKAKPKFKPYHAIVDAAFVKKNLDVPMPANVLLVDSRPYKGKFIKGHIPGAVNMPWSQFDKHVGMLPQEKNTLLIFYCQGPS